MNTTIDTTGVRSSIGHVGVDAGLMTIASDHRFPGEEAIDRLDHKSYPTMERKSNYVISSSGVGDGGYDVVLVKRGGTAVGVEVLFISEAAEARGEEMRRDVGLESPPTEAWRSQAEADRKAVNAYWNAAQAIYTKAWDEVALSVEPEGTPHYLGVLTITEGFSIGDPCYGAASEFVALPAGQYEAIAWTAEMDEWGNRVLRLGVYRTEAV